MGFKFEVWKLMQYNHYSHLCSQGWKNTLREDYTGMSGRKINLLTPN